MPRVTRSSGKTSTAEQKPYTRPANTQTASKAGAKSKNSSLNKSVQDDPAAPTTDKPKPSPSKRTKDPKASHLYTDDNPNTTIQGTGFKDAAKAQETLQLISKRSLLYQWQTVNTMYNRAKHHPHSAKNADIQAAMKIFRTWLDSTYPQSKEAQMDFPTLKKEVVALYLPLIRELKDAEAVVWAEKYAELPKGKRLANTLMDEGKPEERDMAKVRQDFLEEVVRKNGGNVPGKDDGDFLWEKGSGAPSEVHLKCIAYGFSPCKADVLLKRFVGKPT